MARHNALSDETKQAIALDYLAGMSQSKIAEKYGITASTVCKLVSKMKMSEIKEKEPTAAATATSSVSSKDENNLAHTNDNTKAPESQALRGVEVIGLMQTMLIGIEENFGDCVEIMALKADSDTASIMFKYGEKAYSLQFGLAF